MRLNVDKKDAVRIAGWAKGTQPRVEVLVGDRVLDTAALGDPRQDVIDHFGGEGIYRAFSYAFREGELSPGLNKVRLRLLAEDDEADDAILEVDVVASSSWDGFCPACSQATSFRAETEWLRDSLVCTACGSSVRERALAHVLARQRPHWRDLTIHESSPASGGFSARLAAECAHYIGTHYRPDRETGTVHEGYRNENLERQTFPDSCFDVVVTLDVMEHVLNPAAVYAEIHRTLHPGGLYIHTFPIRKWLVEPLTPRVRLGQDGHLEHLSEPEYHGNPIDELGSVVTYDYGYDIHQRITEWAPFSVEVTRFNSRRLGLLGEYTEVLVCTKA